jgi:hypothetical protein
MEFSKSWIRSKTIWGGAVAVLAGALGLFDYTITPPDQAELSQLLESLASTGGGLLAIVGRIVASKRIAA